MFNRVISDPDEIPIPERQRSSTDVCCTVIAALLALILFSISVANFNRDQTVAIYFTTQSSEAGNITQQDYEGFKATLFFTFIITISLGLIWLTVVQFFPDKVPFITYLFAIIACIAIGVLSFCIQNSLFSSNNAYRIILAVLCFLIAIVLSVSLFCYHQQLEFQGILLKYSIRYLFQNGYNFLYIIFFLFCFCGLIVLFLFQHLGFSNIKHSNNNFFNFVNPGFLGVMNILEFLWGLQFLRDAFIFILSGNAVKWYWSGGQESQESSSFDRLFSKNWGSVATGSFMNAFLRIPSNIIEQFICHPSSSCGRCGRFCSSNCNGFISFFGLIRTDSYSYINIFGTPYCDAGRECQKLCENSHHFIGFQSAMRNFRIVAGILLVAVSLILSYLIFSHRVQHINIWFAIDFFVVIIGSMSFFASIHPSIAEGIQTSFLVESYLSSGYDYMQKCIPSFRRQLQALSKRGKDSRSC